MFSGDYDSIVAIFMTFDHNHCERIYNKLWYIVMWSAIENFEYERG